MGLGVMRGKMWLKKLILVFRLVFNSLFLILFALMCLLYSLWLVTWAFPVSLATIKYNLIEPNLIMVILGILLGELAALVLFFCTPMMYYFFKINIREMKDEYKLINKETAKIAKWIISVLETLDYYRPIKDSGLSNFSFVPHMRRKKTFWKSVKKHDPVFWEDTNGFLKTYRKIHGRSRHWWSTIFKTVIVLVLLAMATVLWTLLIIYLQIEYLLLESIPLLAFYLLAIYLFIVPEGTKLRNIVGKEHEEELKSNAGNVIDYLRKFLKENNLNPKDFPIELLHNDYENLVYEEKGKGKYIAFVEL